MRSSYIKFSGQPVGSPAWTLWKRDKGSWRMGASEMTGFFNPVSADLGFSSRMERAHVGRDLIAKTLGQRKSPLGFYDT
jgi:hypothetical protein